MLCADNICKQSGLRSSTTKCRARSGSTIHSTPLFCLFVSVWLPGLLSVCLSACLPCLSPTMLFCPSDFLFSCLSVYFMSSFQSDFPTCPQPSVSACLSVCLWVCPHVCLSVRFSVFLPAFTIPTFVWLPALLSPFSAFLPACLSCLSPTTPFSLSDYLSPCLPARFLSSSQPVFNACPQPHLSVHLSVWLSVFFLSVCSFSVLPTLPAPNPASLSLCFNLCPPVCVFYVFLLACLPCMSPPSSFYLFGFCLSVLSFACLPILHCLSSTPLFSPMSVWYSALLPPCPCCLSGFCLTSACLPCPLPTLPFCTSVCLTVCLLHTLLPAGFVHFLSSFQLAYPVSP